MMLEAHIPLGHGSNQVPQSLTHTWHLRAPLTLMHRLSEPFSLMFGVTYLILGNVSNDLLPTFTHIFGEICILTGGLDDQAATHVSPASTHVCPATMMGLHHPVHASVGEVWSKKIRVFFFGSFSSIPAFCLYTVPGIKVINQYDKK